MEFVQTFILIIILAGGHNQASGAGVTGIEFRSQESCEKAQRKVIWNKTVKRIDAFCVEK